jgi:hypothetical protein
VICSLSRVDAADPAEEARRITRRLTQDTYQPRSEPVAAHHGAESSLVHSTAWDTLFDQADQDRDGLLNDGECSDFLKKLGDSMSAGPEHEVAFVS